MSRPLVLITRPREGADILEHMLEKRGYATLADPMLHLQPIPKDAMSEMEQYLTSATQGVVITSRHALTALQHYPYLHDVLLFTVGYETADAARKLGFSRVIHAPDVHRLLKLILRECRVAEGPLFYARGQHVAYNIGSVLQRHGFSLEEAIVYRMQAATRLSPELLSALAGNTLHTATFLSPRTAEIFLRLLQETPHLPALSTLRAAAFSQQVAARLAAAPWRRVAVCDHPSLASLMDTVDKLAAED